MNDSKKQNMRSLYSQRRSLSRAAEIALIAQFLAVGSLVQAASVAGVPSQDLSVNTVLQFNPTSVDVVLSNNQRMTLDFYGENIFRVFQDNKGGIVRDPQAEPEAKIMVDNPRKDVKIKVTDSEKECTIATSKIKIVIDKETTLFKVINLETSKAVIELVKPIEFTSKDVRVTLKEHADEYFYGGGVQNGRFSHKGKIIAVENQNSWTSGGVASPTPFYWSTGGYGMMWHSFKKGFYNFGAEGSGVVEIAHQDQYLDLFLMVNDGAVPLLNDFYQLTGNPVFMPKFGFYQGHLNAYNRDYWSEVEEGGMVFEDGKRYKESKNTENAVQETLNGEKGDYQFSARAVIDRYNAHDMPLGWLLPNDGYGAGYGQTATLDGNIANLKSLTDYAQEHGVQIGLWTQSSLHPKEGVEALLQRDIVKEVRDAGVRVLKTDVAWVGAGYSFGLNGITDVAQIMTYYGDDARPFIISLDGWAGTQRYAGIWTGDQSGGQWEYIRFHIPTYLGSGLSGQPNISSDMDGIFGGKNPIVNTRDFQWKTFTPQELNMDGWGSSPKYAHAQGEPVASINRMYLKLRAELMPYIYSVAKGSVDGMPIVRAMFLEYPNEYTLGTATQYQFLCGSNFLVAPIYQDTQSDEEGNDVRDDIYLPEGEWVDYFTGQIYKGGRIINNFDAPLWKLPILVKNGAIIPMTNPNNNVAQIDPKYRKYEIYPQGETSFTEYDDDGLTMQYLAGKSATTLIESKADAQGNVLITLNPTQGCFKGFEPLKRTEILVNVSAEPQKLSATVAGKAVELTKATSLEEYEAASNAYYYEAAPQLNQYATEGSDFAKVSIVKNPQVRIKLAETDVTSGASTVSIEGFVFAPVSTLLVSEGALTAPAKVVTLEENITAYTLKPTWDKVENADYYEIEFNGQTYSTIAGTSLTFTDLAPETKYSFKLRAVNKTGQSEWMEFEATTASDPYEFAIKGVSATCSVISQGRQKPSQLFDFDESTQWHTVFKEKVDAFEMVIDLNSVSQIEKLDYLPRENAANGTILEGTVSYSYDKKEWSEPQAFTWARDGELKVIDFAEKPTVRYIKLSVTKSVNQAGSGLEMHIYKVPGTDSFIPGDINSDGKIDSNDLTSYSNYTGLRLGDSDFEGYISVGDINKNNLIDAYDISQVAVKLDAGMKDGATNLQGTFSFKANKAEYKEGEEVVITIKAEGLKDVNALSFALPYDPACFEYVGVKTVGTKESFNMTYDRLHTNGVKALYPTFVNLGDKPSMHGNGELFTITFKAKKDTAFDLKMQDAIIVDKNLNSKEF